MFEAHLCTLPLNQLSLLRLQYRGFSFLKSRNSCGDISSLTDLPVLRSSVSRSVEHLSRTSSSTYVHSANELLSHHALLLISLLLDRIVLDAVRV